MKIVAVILARSASPPPPDNLLPKRPLAFIQGKRVLEWIARRLGASKRLHRVVVAVGDREQDSEIITQADSLGLEVYAGYPGCIMSRLRMAARGEGADHVVRVNGNFPLVDVSSLDEVIDGHLENRADFSLNSHYHGLIYGLGAEVFSARALDRFALENLTPEQKSIGSIYLLHNPEKYRTYFQPSARTAPHFRVSVDFAPDIQVVSQILEHAPSTDNAGIMDFLESRPDLIASQEMTVPAEVSLEKALLFPDKIKALHLNNCVTFDETYPISVELSLTNRCNHHCIWCSDADLRDRLNGELERHTFQRLFKDLKQGGSRGVVIEGGGEPTLYKDFSGIVEDARRQGLALGLITNGYLMPYLGAVEDFEWIRVSLDAASRDQYRELKGVDGFDRVINNLLTIAASRKNTTLGVGYVVTNRNDDLTRLEQLVLFLRKIGASYIQFRPVVDHPELFSAVRLDFLKKYETREFSVNISAMTDNLETGNNGLPCLAHSLSTVIAADGGIYLCGRLNRYESWDRIGKLTDQSFHEIWTGEKRREQVSLVSKAEFCRNHCPQCRMTKYNRLLADVQRIKTRNFI